MVIGYGYGYGNLAYGTKNLTISSPPQSFTEPLTLDEVKQFMKLPPRNPPDPAEDTELTSLISAARRQAEILQGRDLIVKQWDMYYDYWPSYPFRGGAIVGSASIRNTWPWYSLGNAITLGAPLLSVDKVQYTDYQGNVTTMTENTDYVVDLQRQPGLIVPPYNKMWPSYTPWPTSSLLIRFTSGFSASSAWWQGEGMAVHNGMRMLVNEWFMKKLPFLTGTSALQEYPFGLSCSLRTGALINVA